MLVPQFSILVVHREFSSLDILITFTRRWYASLVIFLDEPLSKLFANSLSTAVVLTGDWPLYAQYIKKGDPEDVW